MATDLFVIARNPDPDSSLGYLLSLPLADGTLVLKAREAWPTTAAVYCHRAEVWPDHPDIVNQTPVHLCRRRGVAIDLVLDRPKQHRCQFVFTTLTGGREGIFWHTAATIRKARPGVRVPTRRASGHAQLEILIDTRERYPYRFAHQQATTTRQALPAGDYGVSLHGELVAAIERKSLADLASSLIDGSLTYQLADLARLPRTAVVVEDRYAKIFKLEHTNPGFVAELLATMQIRYPTIPIFFAETRPLAEEWTFRFLGAALTFTQADNDTSLPS
jgi:hypothetical protein